MIQTLGDKPIMKKSSTAFLRTVFAVSITCLALVACVGTPPEKPKTATTEKVDLPEDFDKRAALGRNSEPPVVTLGIGSALKERLASEGDPLPDDVLIDTTNLNGVPVAAALQAVLADTPISLTWQQGSFDDRLVTILNLSGQLPEVVERICSAGRIYCTYRNGTLELKEKETFIIEMPPVPSEAENTIASAIETLAGAGGDGESISVDKDGGNIIYTADTAGQQRVKQYLAQLRRGRPLIVIQMYLWDVTLSENADAGIKWDSNNAGSFPVNATDLVSFTKSGLSGTGVSTAKTAFDTLSGNISFGAVFSGNIDAALVLAFLQKNGDVRTVSNPQLTFVSGSNSEFAIGGKRTYISGVGQLVGSSTSSGGSAGTGVGTNTVQTEEIETGLRVKLSGSYETGVIFGQLDIEDTTLVDLERIESSGTEIQLPITAERELKTVIRLRPGDTLLLAGLRSQRDTNTRSGLPTMFGLLPNSQSSATENRELVIMLKPSIIRFSDEKLDETALQNGVVPPVGETVSRHLGDIEPVAQPTSLRQAPIAMQRLPDRDDPVAPGRVNANGLQSALGDVRRGRGGQ